MISYVIQILGNIFGWHQKRLEGAASVKTKEAIDGTEYLKTVVARLEKLEADRDADRLRLDAADKRADKLERVLERVARGYDELRRNVLKVVRRLRDGKAVEPELLDELESTPDVKELLKGVLDVAE